MNRIDPPRLRPEGRHWMTAPRANGLLGAAVMLGIVALMIDEWRHFIPESVALLLFLLVVLVGSACFGFWTGILSALGAFAIFNFFFVEPHFSFFAARPQDLATLGVFLLAAGLTGLLAGRLREQVDEAEGRAAVLEVLSQASSDLSGAETPEEVLAAAVQHLSELSLGPAMVMAREGERPAFIEAFPVDHRPGASDLQAADQAFSRGRVEFATAEGWSGSRFTFHPIPPGKAATHVLGHMPVADRRDRIWRERAISSVLRQTETALDRLVLAREAEAERRAAEKQALRAALLASLSHDLRTPLATILGSVTTLRDLRQTLPPEAQADLLNAIEEEAQRLARYVEKLLQMTRLVAGVSAHLHWIDPSDAAQAAVARARRAFPRATIAVALPDLPLVRAEAGLLEQALFSLLENAVRYAPGPILMTGAAEAGQVVLSVSDSGPGLPVGVAEWLASAELTGGPGNGGLGLPICKGIARTLGGALSAAAAPGGGAVMSLSLPVPDAA